MEKRWVYKDEPDRELVKKLSREINISEYLSRILVQRGIETFDQAKAFFRPSLSRLHDPFLMLNMDKAVNRLTDAVFNREKILIYGDYDVDGTTSVSLMYLFLKQFTDQLEFYIPDRYSEGYGISEKGINYAIEEKFTLIIALDCGVRAIDRARQAKEAGIDLIICDHHLPGKDLPDAYALLDPKQNDCNYPFKELSGCGVGFKLLEGFCQQNTIEKEKLFEFLDLVAVSIASDIVPIVGENRILAFYGLKKLNQAPSAGLKSLIEISGKKEAFNISDVVFSIGPRINAAGRLTHARESVHLLIGDSHETEAFADNLNDRNKERREFDQTITAEALEMIGELEEDKKSTVLFKKDWHKGVIGIVASRCIEYYHRPTIILTESKGKATGSARSVDGFDVHEAISECADLLEQFGGHTHAAGLTLSIDNIEKFIHRFEQVVSERILPEQLIPKVEIDVEIPLSAISFKTYNIMNQMGPFGPQNMAPVFGTKNVIVDSMPKLLKDKHIKGFLHAENSTKLFEFIGFGLADKLEQIEVGKPFHIAYHLEENNYLGNKSLILNLKDVRFDA
ncbi:MAG: single-stranded-DNA-specific exonuclease RecJ [Ekhidna sp.]|uniref:single-stranded-DNA-specific exonuclease RecJ n=1 Tax=Ekhidna sp. TaxID=2608089 RepID=UPI0032EB727A